MPVLVQVCCSRVLGQSSAFRDRGPFLGLSIVEGFLHSLCSFQARILAERLVLSVLPRIRATLEHGGASQALVLAKSDRTERKGER